MFAVWFHRLSVSIDEHLKWQDHIQYVIHGCSQTEMDLANTILKKNYILLVRILTGCISYKSMTTRFKNILSLWSTHGTQ